MSNPTPTRRVLSDLNVNAFGTPTRVRLLEKHTPSLKRGISDVEDPESSPAPSRVRSEPYVSPKSLKIQGIANTNMPGNVLPKTTITTTSEVADREEEMQEGDSQQSNKGSTASFLDSDIEGDTMASQQTTATDMTMPVQSAVALRAENLRLRLRVALYKVQTNQISIPMSRLQITASRSPISTSPTRPSSRTSPLVFLPSEQNPVQPRLLPAPILRPTAYSARHIAQPQTSSSPPYSTNSSPESAVRDEVFRTPALPRSEMYEPAQMSSPPNSEKENVVHGVRGVDSLTSSTVRGKAAIGLLGLRRAGT